MTLKGHERRSTVEIENLPYCWCQAAYVFQGRSPATSRVLSPKSPLGGPGGRLVDLRSSHVWSLRYRTKQQIKSSTSVPKVIGEKFDVEDVRAVRKRPIFEFQVSRDTGTAYKCSPSGRCRDFGQSLPRTCSYLVSRKVQWSDRSLLPCRYGPRQEKILRFWLLEVYYGVHGSQATSSRQN